MGEKQVKDRPAGDGLQAFTRHVLQDLRALEQIIADGMIESDVQRIGAEQELFLVHRNWRPALKAYEMLAALDDPQFTTELGLFNLECNLQPRVLGGPCLTEMQTELEGLVDKARRAAAALDLEVVLIGILPTLRKSDLGIESMTPEPRYHALSDALNELRGGDYEFHIKGTDELIVRHHTVMLEACNTSFQTHLQVGPQDFPNAYNIAQTVAAPIIAASCNSPLLFGRRLWHETRIALFQQSIDTRSSIDHLRERSPRVTFGRDWVKRSVLELYREDVARFRALLGAHLDEDPFAVLQAGGIPRLKALTMHNSTVYRWNRACYGITAGKPHLRIENRVMPSGPSLPDAMANAALWFGVMKGLCDRYDDITQVMQFADAKSNFNTAATLGLRAQFSWLEGEIIPAQTLICDRLIPMAETALKAHGIDAADVDRCLGIVDRRVRQGLTGAEWQLRSYAALPGRGTMSEKLNAITGATVARQKSGKPVAEWDLARIEEGGGWKHTFATVEQYMTTDLFTVHEDEPVELVANLMDWERIRHVPVEDNEHRLVGLVSYRMLLRILAEGHVTERQQRMAVREIMRQGKDLATIPPETTTIEAIRLMRERRVGCLPVVRDGTLVGIVTQRDFMDVARDLLEAKLAGDGGAG